MDISNYIFIAFFLIVIIGYIWASNEYFKLRKLFIKDKENIEKSINEIKTLEDAYMVMDKLYKSRNTTLYKNFQEEYDTLYKQVEGIKDYIKRYDEMEKV